MKLFTRHIQAQEAPANWRARYSRDKGHMREIQQKLDALPKPIDADKVDEIIGSTSWTNVPRCDECGKEVSAIVRLGEEPDYESSTAYVCRDCLKKALALFGET